MAKKKSRISILLKPLTAALLVLVLLLPILNGCADNNSDRDETPPPSSSVDIGDTTHEKQVTEGDEDFVSAGSSDYTIVYPQNADTKIMSAVYELRSLINEATGASLQIKSDAEKTDKNRILSVGHTAQALSEQELMSKVSSSNLGSNGYIIDTLGTAVYMLGNTGVSALYAAYEFLHLQFSFEAYSADVYYIEKGLSDSKLKVIHVTDVPDFNSRTSIHTSGDRLRTVSYVADFNSADGNTFCHNYFNLVPTSYAQDHPKWFAGTGHTGQLCLEANGDEVERLALKDVVVQSIKDRLLAQPDIDWIAFSHNDGGLWCNCTECQKDYALYDHADNTAAFASVIRFTNLVAKDIKAWNLAECPQRDIKIWIYHYGKVAWAPVKQDSQKNPILDENGNFQPYSEDLILDDNVGVYFCGFSSPMTDLQSSVNQIGVEQIARMKAVMKNPLFYIWCYSTCFNDYLLPVEALSTRQEYYQYFRSVGAAGVFDMGQFNNSASSDFAVLETYVSSKLLWNCQLNVEELVDSFFIHYFDVAAPVMRQMYDEYRAYMNWLRVEKRHMGNNSSTVSVMKDAKSVPYRRVREFLSMIDEAYSAIAPLEQSNPVLYEKLNLRILKESITWRYVELIIYPDSYSQDMLREKQKEFVTDALKAGIALHAELSAMSNLFG